MNLLITFIDKSQDAAKLYANEFNVASSLPNGPVPYIVTENNFNFIFIPSNAIMSDIKNRK